jgi:DNA-binding protein
MSLEAAAMSQHAADTLTLLITPQSSINKIVTKLQKHLFVSVSDQTRVATLSGSGRAISKCITIAEIVQRQTKERIAQTQELSRDYEGLAAQRQKRQGRREDAEVVVDEKAIHEGHFLPRLTITLSYQGPS